jgi:chromosomal replication initiation ATPase DnaA
MLSRVGRLGYGESRLRFSRLRADQEVFALTHAVAVETAVCISKMLQRSRGFGRAARARQIAMYLAHVLLSRPQHDVALLFDRDRTTVAHAMHVVEDRRDDPRLERLIERIERRFERTRTAARRGGDA